MPAAVDPRLAEHRRRWDEKPALRAVYSDYHRRMISALPPEGPILEIGCGSGHLRDVATDRDVTAVDILPSPWTDVCCAAEALPFPANYFDGVVMLDTLHHLADPRAFFAEAVRVLRPGGRIALVEPGITPASWLFYRFVHEEPVDMGVDPLAAAPGASAAGGGKDPFDGNQAIPTLLFTRQVHRTAFANTFPALHLVRRDWLSLVAYPMTGGFQRWSLIGESTVRWLLDVEDRLLPFLGRWTAFRLFVVLERRA